MKQEVKEKWIEALKSGEYKQGNGVLKSGDTYCCLGVLCDLYAKETGNGKWELHKNTFEYFHDGSGDKGLIFLTNTVTDWAGLETANPEAGNEALSGMNDRGETFENIANEIEAHL